MAKKGSTTTSPNKVTFGKKTVGKLKKKYVQRKGWLHHWNGTPGKKGTTYKAYRDQPWEQEAWNRQMYLAETVCRILEEKYP
jgi:hypothetical protein